MRFNRSVDLKSANVNTTFILNGDSSLYSVYLDSLEARVTELNHPLMHDDFATLVMGSCNSLILISNDVEDSGLWNPSTRKYQKLPYFKFKQPRGWILGQYHARLGYDQTTNDYKVVRIMQACNLNNHEAYAEMIAFSLKSGSWKRIQNFPLWISQEARGLFALGALRWVVDSGDEEEVVCMIVVLDLGTEEYELMPLPLHLNVASRVDFGVLLSCNYNLDHVNIWMMEERGKTESWTKLLSVGQVDVNRSLVNVKP